MMMQGMFEAIDLDLISHYQLQPVLHNVEQLEMLAKARLNSPLHVHLKCPSASEPKNTTRQHLLLLYT
jgi:alanine racemase